MLRWTIHFLEISSNDFKILFLGFVFDLFSLYRLACLQHDDDDDDDDEKRGSKPSREWVDGYYADAGHLTRRDQKKQVQSEMAIIINKEIDIPASIKSSGEEDFLKS